MTQVNDICICSVCSVVNYSNPKDRMVAVVRWYLSAFHAGRKVRLFIKCRVGSLKVALDSNHFYSREVTMV